MFARSYRIHGISATFAGQRQVSDVVGIWTDSGSCVVEPAGNSSAKAVCIPVDFPVVV